MKTPLFPFVIPACVALLMAAGCSSAPVRHPSATKVVVLSPGHPSPRANIAILSAVQVILPGPAAGSGYVWEIISNNRKVLEQMGPLRPVPDADARAPATMATFFGLISGRSTLGFALVLPNQAESVPAARCSLTVVVEE